MCQFQSISTGISGGMRHQRSSVPGPYLVTLTGLVAQTDMPTFGNLQRQAATHGFLTWPNIAKQAGVQVFHQ